MEKNRSAEIVIVKALPGDYVAIVDLFLSLNSPYLDALHRSVSEL